VTVTFRWCKYITKHKTIYADGLLNVSAHNHTIKLQKNCMYVLTTIWGFTFQIVTHFFYQSGLFHRSHTSHFQLLNLCLQNHSLVKNPMSSIWNLFMIIVRHNMHYRMEWCVFLQVLFSVIWNELSLAVQTQM
jgi:hypothetical protein